MSSQPEETSMHRTTKLHAGKAVVALAVCAAAALLAPAGAAPKTITLPADPVQLVPSNLPGYAKAQASCVSCHSAEYMLYQPPNAGRAYWENMTKRMKAVFKAPINDADIPAIVDYLTATYGNHGK
jgi:mono/diheme cytochrome c family protein